VAAGLPPGYPFQFKTARAGRRKLGEARSLGSIAYEIGIVATGGFGWAIFRGPKIWDVAGGIPIIREAGGVALRYSQSRGGWFPLDRFEAPGPKSPDKPARLRDWGGPVIVGAAPLVAALAPQIAPRHLPIMLTSAMRGYRGWRRFLPRKEPKPAPATDGPGEPAAP
jgi:myo-inositol-1(or 4)-monophosphatase